MRADTGRHHEHEHSDRFWDPGDQNGQVKLMDILLLVLVLVLLLVLYLQLEHHRNRMMSL